MTATRNVEINYLKGKYEVCEIEVFVKYYFNHAIFGGVIFIHDTSFAENPALLIFRTMGKLSGFLRRIRAWTCLISMPTAIDNLEFAG